MEDSQVFMTPITREQLHRLKFIGDKLDVKDTRQMKVGDIVTLYVKRFEGVGYKMPGIYGYGVVSKLENGLATVTITKFVFDRPLIHLNYLKKYTDCFNRTSKISRDVMILLHNLNSN